MHPFTIINKFFNSDLKSKKELKKQVDSLSKENHELFIRTERLHQDLIDYSNSLSDINYQLKEKEEENEELRDQQTAHMEVQDDVSKVVFEISVDENEEIVVVPKTQYNNEITSALASNGSISMEDSNNDFTNHIGMILCAYDACDTIVSNFKGEE